MRMLLFSILLWARATAAEIEFSSYISTPNGWRFVVRETKGNKHSEFLKIGQSFGGYTVAAFLEKRETLVLERDGLRIELPIIESRVRSGADASDVNGPAEQVLIFGTDGTISSASGAAIEFGGIAQVLRSSLPPSGRLHVVMVVPRMPKGTNSEPVLNGLREVTRLAGALHKELKARVSFELVNVDASLVPPKRRDSAP